MHFHCLLLTRIVSTYAFSVCKILSHKKLGPVIFFWQIPSLLRQWSAQLRLRSSFRFQPQRRLWVWLHLLSQVQEQVNREHTRAILIWGGEPKWEAAPSNRFKNLSSFASLPPKVVSLSISVMWAVLVLDGYQKILAVLFLCVKKKKDAPVLFPSYFEGTRPNRSQWMRSQRGQLIDIVMHKCWFIPQNSQKENKGISKAQYKMKTDLLTTY